MKKLNFKEFKKNDYLLKEGEICRYYFFVLQGLTRTFYINSNGNDKITQFGIEHWWFTNIDSFVNQQPSLLYIQALEPTRTLVITHENLEDLYREIPKTERLFRKITEKMLIALHKRSEFYLQKDGEIKYLNFLNQIPGFVQRVPQYILASYLEMTPEHLSYVRKNMHKVIS